MDFFFHFAMQHGGIWAGLAEMPNAADRNAVNHLGSYAGIQSFIYKCILNYEIFIVLYYEGAFAQTSWGADSPPAGDLETATKLGQRVAKLVQP